MSNTTMQDFATNVLGLKIPAWKLHLYEHIASGGRVSVTWSREDAKRMMFNPLAFPHDTHFNAEDDK